MWASFYPYLEWLHSRYWNCRERLCAYSGIAVERSWLATASAQATAHHLTHPHEGADLRKAYGETASTALFFFFTKRGKFSSGALDHTSGPPTIQMCTFGFDVNLHKRSTLPPSQILALVLYLLV
jgi:hypothetical protein